MRKTSYLAITFLILLTLTAPAYAACIPCTPCQQALRAPYVSTWSAIEPIEPFPGVHLTKVLHPVRESGRGVLLEIPFDLSFMVIDPGQCAAAHQILGTSETMYIVRGKAEVCANRSTARVSAGQVVSIPPYAVQSVANGGDSPLVYLSVLDPYWAEERDLRLEGGAAAPYPADEVQLIVADRTNTKPGIYFDSLLLYPFIQPPDLREKGIETSIGYGMSWVTIPPGGGSRPHYLKGTVEVISVLSGTATAVVGEEVFQLSPGQTIYIPPGGAQAVRNTGIDPLEYLSIVQPYWQPGNDVEVAVSGIFPALSSPFSG